MGMLRNQPRLRTYKSPMSRRLRKILKADVEYDGFGRFVALLSGENADVAYCVFNRKGELVKYRDTDVFAAYLKSWFSRVE